MLKPRFSAWVFLGFLLFSAAIIVFLRLSSGKVEIQRLGNNLSLGLARYLAAPIAMPGAGVVTRAPTTACEREVEDIASLDLSAFGRRDPEDSSIFAIDHLEDFFVRLAQLSRAGRCDTAELPAHRAVFAALSEMNAACADMAKLGLERSLQISEEEIVPEKMVRSPFDKCVNALNEVRQEVAEFSTRNTPIELIRDVPTLTQKLMGYARKHPTDLKTMTLLAKRMVELEPESSEAQALLLQVTYADWRKNPDSEDKLARAAQLQDASDRLMELSPQNSFYAQYRLQFELDSGNLTTVREIAERLANDDSSMNLGKFYLAQLAFRDGDTQRASGYLNEVMSAPFANQKIEASVALQLMARAPASDRPRPPFGAPSVYLPVPAFSVVAPGVGGETIQQLVGLASYPLLEDSFMSQEDPEVQASVREAFDKIGFVSLPEKESP